LVIRSAEHSESAGIVSPTGVCLSVCLPLPLVYRLNFLFGACSNVSYFYYLSAYFLWYLTLNLFLYVLVILKPVVGGQNYNFRNRKRQPEFLFIVVLLSIFHFLPLGNFKF